MPTLSSKSSALNSEIRFRVPIGLRKVLEKRVKKMDISLSEYARNVFLMVSGAFDEEINRLSNIRHKQGLTDKKINKAIKEIRSRRS